QIRGEPLDGRADIYSFGATAYELVTARPPFRGSSNQDLLNKHILEKPMSPQIHNPDLTNEFAELVLRMLAKKREHRPRDFDEFVELHGDRAIGDDRALRTGFARLGDFRIMLIGHQKGHTLKENNECLYGCAHPEGYRKALNKMRTAAKFGLPIICLIDTPGAYPGIGAEERGQAQL